MGADATRGFSAHIHGLFSEDAAGLVKAMKKEDGCHDAGAIFQKLMHKKRHLGQWDCEENCVSVCVCVCVCVLCVCV